MVNKRIRENSLKKRQLYLMAESETGLTNLMNYLDLEDVNNTDYDRDIDAEIINVLYYQDVAFMNDNFVVNKLKTCFDRSREKSLLSIKSNF